MFNSEEAMIQLQNRTGISETSAFINNLPFELLSRIFRKCLRHSDGEMPHLFPSDKTPPFTFLLVCKYWRDSALETRCLWASVGVPQFTLKLTEPDANSRHDFIKKWLSRSGNLPLRVRHTEPAIRFIEPSYNDDGFWRDQRSIDTRFRVGAHDRAYYHALQMLEALVHHESRWRSLEIAFDSYLLQDFDRICQAHKPSVEAPCLGSRLHTLKITLEEAFYTAINVMNISQWIAKLPALVTLDLEDRAGHLADFKVVPFYRPKVVKFTRQTFPNHLDSEDGILLMSLCTSATDIILVGCKLLQINRPFQYLVAEKQDVLPRLQRLTLIHVDSSIEVLNAFTLPALECFEITSGFAGCSDNAINLFEDFLDRSRCPLKRLRIYDVDMAMRQAIRILGIPSLTDVAEVTLALDDISILLAFNGVISNEGTTMQQPFYSIGISDFEHEHAVTSAFENTNPMVSNGVLRPFDRTLLESLNFMVWKQGVGDGEVQKCFASGYRMGWKCLQDGERFEFAFRNGKIQYNSPLSG